MKRSKIAHQSKSGKILASMHSESRNVCALIYRMNISGWYIPCARCLKMFDLDGLTLDEVDEGRHVHIIHDGNNPGRQQFLCLPCHAIKTDEGHRDYLGENLPKIRADLKEFEGLFLALLPRLPGQMKHSLKTERDAFDKAKRIIYDRHSPKRNKAGKLIRARNKALD